jgi:methionyl aminopeptidase
MSNIIIKTPAQIEAMRPACRLASETLEETAKILRAGMTTNDINAFVHEYTIKNDATPAPLNYRGFPKSVCTSINEVVCHGIPGKRKLKEGDIINVDITLILNRWHGDVSATFYIGEPSNEACKLVKVTKKCLSLGIAEVRPGARLGDIGAAIQTYAESKGCSVVRDFVGHGIGEQFHEAPQVPHFGQRGRDRRMKRGMVFTIEPMINLGDWRLHTISDGWTAVTNDGKLSAQFEHTIAVTEDGAEILTAFSHPLQNSEND